MDLRTEPFALDRWSETEHEHVALAHDPETGLRAVVALHSTVLGPAFGGTRWFPYGTVAEALTDVLRLSEAMSLKAAGAGLDVGGGKAVIIGDPTTQRSDRLLEAYGRIVDEFNGRFITGEDVGTTSEDMKVVRRVTPHVAGLPLDVAGSGDPSPATARGVYSAIRATAEHLWGSRDLAGRRVVVVGVGKVGSVLVDYLVVDGCEVLVADIDERALRSVVGRHQVEVIDVADALTTRCDVLSLAALGGSLNEASIAELQCQAVVGPANNQLAHPDSDAATLWDRGVLYVPDFVVNAGGLVYVVERLRGNVIDEATASVDRIGDSVSDILKRASAEGTNAHRMAVRLAQGRLGLGPSGRGGMALEADGVV